MFQVALKVQGVFEHLIQSSRWGSGALEAWARGCDCTVAQQVPQACRVKVAACTGGDADRRVIVRAVILPWSR